MSEWKESKLKDITIFIKDGTHGTHKDFPNGIPLLSAKDIENGKILIPDDCRTISQNDYNQIHANYELEHDDIVLTIVGTIGRVAIVKNLKKRITFQRSVGIMRFDNNLIYPEYSFYYFQSSEFQQKLERGKNASAQGGVYLGSLAKASIYHPFELPEQRKIARILSTADTVIEKTQSAIAKYKAIKQGMLHDLFTRGIDPATGKVRPIYEDAPHLYKQSKLDWIPNEWEVEKLEKICSMKSGDGITSLRIRNPDDYPVYGGNGLRGFTNSFTHDGEYTLIGRQGALCGNITRVSGKFYASEHAVVVTVENDIDVDWLSQKLETMKLNQYSEASAQPGLSVNKVMKLLVVKPLFEEQKKISNRLISIDNKLKTELSYLQKLQQIKAGLMADLLSGKKKVTVDEEPAN